MGNKLRSTAIALAFVGSFIVVGCNDDKDTVTTATPPVATPTPAPTPTPEATPTPETPPPTGGLVGFLGTVRFMDGNDLTISGRFVTVTATTQFRHADGTAGTFAELHVGDDVQVRGSKTADNKFDAVRISWLK